VVVAAFGHLTAGRQQASGPFTEAMTRYMLTCEQVTEEWLRQLGQSRASRRSPGNISFVVGTPALKNPERKRIVQLSAEASHGP
ncbi:MAG: hypothetical protein ABSG43_26585, partial [Solirubrobacteraceae bacterium]